MKKLLFAILIAVPVLASGQDSKASNPEIKNNPQQYSCQELEMTADGKMMTLRKNVKIETENLVLSADSAVFNDENQTWLAFGIKELSFKSQVMVVVEEENLNNTIRYKLGDKTIYLE